MAATLLPLSPATADPSVAPKEKADRHLATSSRPSVNIFNCSLFGGARPTRHQNEVWLIPSLDVTHQALIAARLRAQQLEEFFETMPDCLVEMEIGSRRVTLMNAAARLEFGYTLTEIDGLNAVDLIHPDYFAIIQQVHLRYAGESIANRTPYRRTDTQEIFEWVLRRKDGAFFAADVEGSYVLDQEDVPVRARYLFRDVSQRKQAEEERISLIEQLREAIASVHTLHGLLPICAICKNVRDDRGYWTEIESYMRKHASTDFSHGLCPSCRAEVRQ